MKKKLINIINKITWKKILVLLGILIMCSAIFCYFKYFKRTTVTNSSTRSISTTNYVINEEPISVEVTTINLKMIGDVLIHSPLYKNGKQSDGSYNFDHFFANISQDISTADISIVNQETILGGTELGLSTYPKFNSPKEVGDAEVKAGFNTILHATNHTLDKGEVGLNNCLDFWKSKHPNVTILGINETETDYNNIYVYTKNDFKIAILNYTYDTNGLPIPSNKPYCINTLDEDKVISDIEKAKKLADMVIVCPHWGTEYKLTPDDYQDTWTQLFLEHGVDIVIGTHPHVLQPIETLTSSSEHTMLVYYSLGNFISCQDTKECMIGGMADITLEKDSSGKCRIKQYGLVPIVTHRVFTMGQYTSYKLSDYTQSLVDENTIKKYAFDFSIDWINTFCKDVLGDNYDTTNSIFKVELD